MPAERQADRRPRIAIVSTYDELCGIAGYTRAIEKQLAPYADLQIFDLDQYLLKSTHRRVRRLADQHILEIARALRGYDSVNIQLEHGTLGRTSRDIIRRFRILANAAPALSVTMHTVLIGDDLPYELMGRLLRKGRIIAMFEAIGASLKSRVLSHSIHGQLRRLQARKPVSVIVHAKRDMRMMRDIFRLNNVFHHPLSFIAHAEAWGLRQRTRRNDFSLIETLPADVKLVGTFGFLSSYKGFETAIRALNFLPENYHLLIFGGVHPQGIKREQAIDPYIAKLLQAARIGQTPLDHLRESGLALSPGGDVTRLIAEHPETLRARVHFMGALSDSEFAAAMALCDAAVFPYIEVGQSSSGPISIALEMGTRVIASRTAAFRAYARYHPDLIEFFDIGNYAELAGRIAARGRVSGRIPELVYNTETNARLYLEANGCAAAHAPGQEAALQEAAE
ncbi:hypothetical protein [Acidocella sp.]|uniref:hypothetical protein n=1 Tax=Acidocella sp. TaxID=50710 RepID=UPI00260469D7|nr:hypothetical protein [Acidocella sp.]MDD2796081.1 hypothetical protein [Acidocella sp.]